MDTGRQSRKDEAKRPGKYARDFSERVTCSNHSKKYLLPSYYQKKNRLITTLAYLLGNFFLLDRQRSDLNSNDYRISHMHRYCLCQTHYERAFGTFWRFIKSVSVLYYTLFFIRKLVMLLVLDFLKKSSKF